MFSSIAHIFTQVDIPKEYHSTFRRLYYDIAWFGVLSGSVVSFLSVYATRIGATELQIGLIGAMSAIVNLFLAIPAGRWLEKRDTNRAIFRASVLHRVGFLVFILLPSFLSKPNQISAIILITFFMAIPLTPLGVGFNALFAEAVPERYRAHVAGTRNIMLAIAYVLTSLISGYILDNIPFPLGYQIVFGIGALGAAMSSYHLYFIKPIQDKTPASQTDLPAFDRTQGKPAPSKPTDSPRGISSLLRLDILSTPFRKTLFALLAFHIAHNITSPIYPIYNVRVLHLNDDHIGISQALYYLTMLIGSIQLKTIVHRLGHKSVTGLGAMGLSLYPLLLAFTHEVWQFYAIALIGGFTWAWANGAYANYMLENIPPDDRPSHLAWYTIILNLSILISSLGGSSIATSIGLFHALILFAFLRVLAGVIILKWG